MWQTWILIIISILFVIVHYNHVLHIRIHDVDALDLQEKLFTPPFSLLSKFICEMCQTWILIIISIFFVFAHYNHVLHIGIYNVNALDLQEKIFIHRLPYNQSLSINLVKVGFS